MNVEQVGVELLQGGVITLVVATGAWVVAAILGLVIAIMHETRMRGTRWPILITTLTLRSIPELVLIYLLFFGLGEIGIQMSPIVAAIMSLGLVDAVFNGEYFRASLMNVPQSQRDAGASIGLRPIAVFRKVVLPQALPFAIPPLMNSYAGLLKAATLASAVGVPEILYRSETIMSVQGQLLIVSTLVIVLYVVVTVPLTRLVGMLEKRARAQQHIA
jgi:His/Glu/Gln/Arg/opine family amino acid ABC transporter permease subunit